MMRRTIDLLILTLLLSTGGGLCAAADDPCDDGGLPWPSIGVEVFRCPGGSCSAQRVGPQADREEAQGGGFSMTLHGGPMRPDFDFSSEPALFGIAPDGPAAGLVEEEDVLVAVNGYLITTARGGGELARLAPGAPARLTLRRGDRLVEVTVRSSPSCEPPVILSGERVRLAVESDPSIARMAGGGSVGLGLECSGCRFNLGDPDGPWTGNPRPRKVASVQPNSYAAQAGLRAGDEIIEVDGKDMRTRAGNGTLFRYLFGHEDDDREVSIAYRRAGRRHETTLFVPGRPGPSPWEQWEEGQRGLGKWGRSSLLRSLFGGNRSGAKVEFAPSSVTMHGTAFGTPHLGMMMVVQPGFLWATEANGRFRWECPEYLEISSVNAGGPAERAGLQSGDVLTHVNGRDVRTPEGGRLLVLANQHGERLEIRYLRDGRERSTVLEVAAGDGPRYRADADSGR